MPFCAKVVEKLSVADVAPGMLVKPEPESTCHCTVGGGKPFAAAVKVAVPPAQTVTGSAGVLMVGASFTRRVKVCELVPAVLVAVMSSV